LTRDDNELERAAIAIEEGGIPTVYAQAFAQLQLFHPSEVPNPVWELAINDAGLFLDKWGALAEYLDWAVEDIFGAPVHGQRARGLIWKLAGRRVVALLTRGVIVSAGRDRTPDPAAGDSDRPIRIWLRA
jgi:hypothetical protein